MRRRCKALGCSAILLAFRSVHSFSGRNCSTGVQRCLSSQGSDSPTGIDCLTQQRHLRSALQKMSLSSTADSTHRRFGRFRIPESSVFYSSEHSFAFTNLRPIVPGHVLVVSNNIVPTLGELTNEEYVDLWQSVRIVQSILKSHYQKDCQAFNVAVQDGAVAGQSVPHVHVHILPRVTNDYERNDDIYQDLEEWAPRVVDPSNNAQQQVRLRVHDQRRDRTVEEMAQEAEQYRLVSAKMNTT